MTLLPSPARYIGVSLITGVIFAALDGILNANPLAQAAYAVFSTIARPGINIVAGVCIDVGYGFALAAIYLVLHGALPGGTWLVKGLSYAMLVWFFRILMNAAGQWIAFAIPPITVGYSVAAGLVEMLVLGVILGLLLKPASFRDRAS